MSDMTEIDRAHYADMQRDQRRQHALGTALGTMGPPPYDQDAVMIWAGRILCFLETGVDPYRGESGAVADAVAAMMEGKQRA